MTDGSGSTVYCYDRFGALVRKVQSTNGQSFTLRYVYAANGQLQKTIYPDNAEASYLYDAQGRRQEINVKTATGTTIQLLRSASYHPFGPVQQWTYGNGRVMTRTLNLNGEPGIVQVNATDGLSLGYEFDEVGNLKKLRNGNQNDPPLRVFGYDALNRLTETRDGSTNAVLQSYAYDATGNRTSATVSGVTTTNTYETASHRMIQVGTWDRTYDNAGNTTYIAAPTGKTLVYGDHNRLTQVLNGATVAMNYVYNGMGERVRKYLNTANTYTLYDDAGRWLGDYGNAGAPTQQVIWFDDLPVGVLEGAGANQKLHYIEPDALGTPRVVIDRTRGAQGVAIWRWDLTGEAFGTTVPNENPDGDATAFVFDMRFPGQRYDAASGMNYNYFRDYEPGTGRYSQSDPIGLAGGISTYGYVGGNSMVRIDPLGLIDTARARLAAMLARGDISEAVFYAEMMSLPAATRLQQLQTTIQQLMNRYPLVSNRCEVVAKGIFDAMRANRLSPQYLKINPTRTNWMYISDRYSPPQHFAVRLGDRVFDSTTGPGGMLYAEYIKALDLLNGGRAMYTIQILDNIDNFL